MLINNVHVCAGTKIHVRHLCHQQIKLIIAFITLSSSLKVDYNATILMKNSNNAELLDTSSSVLYLHALCSTDIRPSKESRCV